VFVSKEKHQETGNRLSNFALAHIPFRAFAYWHVKDMIWMYWNRQVSMLIDHTQSRSIEETHCLSITEGQNGDYPAEHTAFCGPNAPR
jgi:hypothetical protein